MDGSEITESGLEAEEGAGVGGNHGADAAGRRPVVGSDGERMLGGDELRLAMLAGEGLAGQFRAVADIDHPLGLGGFARLSHGVLGCGLGAGGFLGLDSAGAQRQGGCGDDQNPHVFPPLFAGSISRLEESVSRKTRLVKEI